jgi:hypothetical protein
MYCFVDPLAGKSYSPLQELTFEHGSRLRGIASDAFIGCHLLEFLCLPASVETIEGGAFGDSAICALEIEDGNTFFRVSDCFLMDFNQVSVLYYFGMELTVTIPDRIETIGKQCFSRDQEIVEVAFSPTSRINVIGARAFHQCEWLRSFYIPASVTSIGKACFLFCDDLSEVTYEEGSQLVQIDRETFSHCSKLKAIAIPSLVQSLGWGCFLECSMLETVTMPPDSQLARLDEWAFYGCGLISSIFLPASVECIGKDCFQHCHSLSTLTFGEPSRLEVLLSVPPRWPGFHPIPDSVKRLGLMTDWASSSQCVLGFGLDSRLESVEKTSDTVLPTCRCFVVISTRSLKRIRSHTEFSDELESSS